MLGRTKEQAVKKKATVGKYLASIRKDRGLTLRQVEEAIKKEVSNAYLSQIENDLVKEPSPHVLHTLAEFYQISYQHLMELAGYVVGTNERGSEERHGRLATFAEHNLTPEEEAELIEYLDFLRSRKKPRDQTR